MQQLFEDMIEVANDDKDPIIHILNRIHRSLQQRINTEIANDVIMSFKNVIVEEEV